jgi:hypothetical protein
MPSVVDHEIKRIHYGDIISLYKDEIKSEKYLSRAFLTAEGFNKTNCWLKLWNPIEVGRSAAVGRAPRQWRGRRTRAAAVALPPTLTPVAALSLWRWLRRP